MPITRELENLKKFEKVGFNHEQAEALAEVIERAQVDGQQSLKEFIHNENNDIRSEINGVRGEINGVYKELNSKITTLGKELDGKTANISKELDSKITCLSKDLDGKITCLRSDIISEMNKELKDLLIKIFGIIVGAVGVAVTILKLFP